MKTLLALLITVIVALNCIAQQTSTFTDPRDGQVYKTVKIGNQTWMAENLNFKPQGDSWCYENEDFLCDTYGRLYPWRVAIYICPRGWRLPSEEDFKILLDSFGGRGSNAYHALKDGGSSGFSALFGGGRWDNGNFNGIGSSGGFWSSSECNFWPSSESVIHAWRLHIGNSNASIARHFKHLGFSVRCIKND